MASVAAVVINYNYGAFLGACLASIDAQSHEDLRVIVVDDCSTDDSRDIIEAWRASTPLPAHVIYKDRNRGPAHSYNLAIAALTSADDHVAFIDSDDVWLPVKIAVQVRAMETFGERCAVVYSDTAALDDHTGAVSEFSVDHLEPGETAISRLLTTGCFLGVNGTLVRASGLRAIGNLDERNRVCDLQLWLKMTRVGTFEYEPAEVGLRRQHGGSMRVTETLVGDRLRILGDHVMTSSERRDARTRGRKLLKAGAMSPTKAGLDCYLTYLRGSRDPVTALFVILRLIPGSDAVLRWAHRRLGARAAADTGA